MVVLPLLLLLLLLPLLLLLTASYDCLRFLHLLQRQVLPVHGSHKSSKAVSRTNAHCQFVSTISPASQDQWFKLFLTFSTI